MDGIRRLWPILAALVVGAVLLVIGRGAPGDRAPWSPVGIAADFWMLVLTALAVGLLWQLFINHQAAVTREAHLVQAAAELREESTDLARIARSLNNRPRKTLGAMTPLEKLTELLEMTA